MIIVDGCKSDKEISNFANLEEVLTTLMDDEKMDDRVVTDVFVNNESFSEIYPHQAEDVSCDTITSVEVRSVPAAELAVDMSAEMGKVARMMGSGARNVARLFREASDTDALELFQDLLDVTRDFMGMLGVLRERYLGGADEEFTRKAEKLTELLSEMSDVLENEDWILLADLLEFEFNPVCEAWNKNLEKLRADIARRLD